MTPSSLQDNPLLTGLNDKQREAVSAPLGNTLVLAGAGSGKTRVLVHRIAWLMTHERLSPLSILSVTFTNKAAAEMRSRIEHLTHGFARGLWNGTFHGICHRILRAHYQAACLPQDFQIIDSDDQIRLIRRLVKAQNLDDKQWQPKQIAWWINGKKDEGLRPDHIEAYFDPITKRYAELYQAYQETCDKAGLVDFAEILLRAHELLRDNDFIREHYQARFRYILVDEFQDTNKIQYAWLKMMAGGNASVMIVGDDDQSIYGWRGAKIENIEKFTREFKAVDTIRLEQNYRSTKKILEAANTLIHNNRERMGKSLWTDGADGSPIAVYSAFNELDEARFVVSKIIDWQKNGNKLQEVAILYRNNAQSRVLEDALLQQNMPYCIYGGMRFFERQEIKDALAYLRLMSNRFDDAAFERVINTPTRGIGEKTLETIRHNARDRGCTLWEASTWLLREEAFSGRAQGALSGFIELINGLDDECQGVALHLTVDCAINRSGLYQMYLTEKGEKSKARIENLEELVSATKEFNPDDIDDMSPLTAFLVHAALESGDSQADEFEDAVQMMTLHSAKGLEFPLVFIVGLEEGMFPSQMSKDDPVRLEEERRLCYVGITRAMDKLYLSHAESRRLYGQEKHHKASRFIGELPAQCLEEIRIKAHITRPSANSRFSMERVKETFNETGFAIGQKVKHVKFGYGTIINFEGTGAQSRVQVVFEGQGIKWLVTAYARLEKL